LTRRAYGAPMPKLISLIALVLVLAATAAGCGSSGSSGGKAPTAKEISPAGDIPDNQAYVAFAVPSAGFTVKVPEGWARTGAAGAVTFTDKLNSVRIEGRRTAALPTVATAKRTEVPALARAYPGLSAPKVTAVRRSGLPGVRITFLAKAKPDAVTGKSEIDAVERYLLARGGRVAVVTLSGPQKADNVDPWKLVSNSVRFR
jgi:hypothetical protein